MGCGVNFGDRPPSTKWATLTHKGEVVAEAWLKPNGDPHALTFRIPQDPSPASDLRRRLTSETLLRSVGVPAEDVAWLRAEEVGDGVADLRQPLPPAPPGAPYLTVRVRLKPPAPPSPPVEPSGDDIPLEQWQDLDARWQAVLALEAGITALRMSADGLRAELESAARGGLTSEDKMHALQ